MSEYKRKKIWVVGDIEEKAKDEAKRLAKLSKKKVGPWLSELILNKKPQSAFDIAGQLDSSNDIRKIITYLEKLHVELHDVHIQLSSLTYKIQPLEKKTFFDKFLK